MPDYSKGKIYSITFEQNELMYIGSTIQPLKDRFSQHKKKPIGRVMRQLFNLESPRITLIENFPCNNRDELNRREDYHVSKYNTVNWKNSKRINFRVKNMYISKWTQKIKKNKMKKKSL